MAEIPTSFLVHRALVRPLLGHGPYGEDYGPEFEIPCFISHKRRLVRNLESEEVVSEATVRAPLAYAQTIVADSLIRLHSERATPDEESVVIQAAPNTDGAFGAWQHLRLDV